MQENHGFRRSYSKKQRREKIEDDRRHKKFDPDVEIEQQASQTSDFKKLVGPKHKAISRFSSDRRSSFYNIDITALAQNKLLTKPEIIKEVLKFAGRAERDTLNLINLTHTISILTRLYIELPEKDRPKLEQNETFKNLIQLAEFRVSNGEGSPRELSTLAYSLRRLARKDNLTLAILDRALNELSNGLEYLKNAGNGSSIVDVAGYNGMDIGAILCTVMDVDSNDQNICEMMSDSLRYLIPSMNPMALGLTCLGIRKLALNYPELLDKIDKRIIEIKDESFSVTNLEDIIAMYGVLQRNNHRVLEILIDKSKESVPRLSSVARSYLFYSMSRLLLYPEELMNKMIPLIPADLSKASERHLFRVLNAMAKLNIQDEKALDSAVVRYHQLEPQISEGMKVMIIGALCVINSDKYNPMILRVVKTIDRGLLTSKEMARLHSIEVALGLRGVEEFPMGYASPLRERNPSGRNNFESEVFSILKELEKQTGIDLNIRSGELIADIETDFIISIEGREVIIEADGVINHYINHDSNGMPSGRDKFQDRIFKMSGYEVVHIPSDVWKTLNRPGRAEWLREKIFGLQNGKPPAP